MMKETITTFTKSIKWLGLLSLLCTIQSFGQSMTSSDTGSKDSTSLKHNNSIDTLNPKIGQLINTQGIYFEMGGPRCIRVESHPLLDSIVSILHTVLKTNHCFKIEVGNFTDCRASVAYNDTISKFRAECIKDYFVKHGIDQSNLTYHGYGERYLLNNCACEPNNTGPGKDCTEAEHAVNRRTEIKIIGIKEGCK